MCLNVITMNELGPLSLFLDEGACKNTLLPQLDDGPEDTEATVQDDHMPLVEYGASIQSNNPTVEPLLSNSCCPRALGQSLPSTRSIPHMIPEVQQQMVWYSLPNGHGLQGMNMNPGHVNLFVQMLMLSSRQFTYPGTKFSTM